MPSFQHCTFRSDRVSAAVVFVLVASLTGQTRENHAIATRSRRLVRQVVAASYSEHDARYGQQIVDNQVGCAIFILFLLLSYCYFSVVV